MRKPRASTPTRRSRASVGGSPSSSRTGRLRPVAGILTYEAAARARDRLSRTRAPGADASFACFWRRWLADKQPYLTEGSLEDLETHGRKRLLPHLAHVPIGAITEQHIRDWLARMIEQQRSGAISAKTINNARAALSCALADASRHGLLPHNPCQFVAPLPVEHRELDYLRLAEIDRYLDACTRALPTPRRTAHRHRRSHLRSARTHLARPRPRAGHRAHPPPAAPPRRQARARPRASAHGLC